MSERDRFPVSQRYAQRHPARKDRRWWDVVEMLRVRGVDLDTDLNMDAALIDLWNAAQGRGADQEREAFRYGDPHTIYGR